LDNRGGDYEALEVEVEETEPPITFLSVVRVVLAGVVVMLMMHGGVVVVVVVVTHY